MGRKEEIYNKLNTINISTDLYNKLIKDRLDFGFDSLYFRYAEVCDELAAYIARINGTDPIKERNAMWGRKSHFYTALEQLLIAHEEESEDK